MVGQNAGREAPNGLDPATEALSVDDYMVPSGEDKRIYTVGSDVEGPGPGEG